jgi:hypothetical protein
MFLFLFQTILIKLTRTAQSMHFKMLHQDKKKHHHTNNYVSNCYHGFQKYTLINVAVNVTLVSKMSLIVNLSKIIIMVFKIPHVSKVYRGLPKATESKHVS